MRRKGRPKKQKSVKIVKVPGKRGRPRKKEIIVEEPPLKKAKRGRPKTIKIEHDSSSVAHDPLDLASSSQSGSNEGGTSEENYSEGLHMSTLQVRALSSLVACLECGEEVILGVRPTTKGMISEFTVTCKVCDSQKSTNTPNLIRERKRKREKKGVILQKNENINYAHVAAFLDNGLGYSGLRHYCKYFNARCLNEATFIVYAKQVIYDVVAETEEFMQQNARIVRKAFESQLHNDFIIDLTVGYTTTYHQWGSDFCLVAGAVIELQTGLVLDYDVGNMYCHVCKINAKKIVSMSPAEMTEWFNKHQDTCEIREWCDEIDQDSEEGIKEIDPKYLESFIAKKIWSRSIEKFGFRYTTLIHESDERIHAELLKAAPYEDIPVMIDTITNCYSRRKSEHARTSFQNKLKSKCPRERVQTKDRIMYVYAMSIPEYNKFAIGSNIKLRELVRRMEIEEEEYASELSVQASEVLPAIQEQEMLEEKLGNVGDAFEVEKDDDDDEEEDDDDDEEEEMLEESTVEEEIEEEIVDVNAEDQDEEMREDEEAIDSQAIEVLEEEDDEIEDSQECLEENLEEEKVVKGKGKEISSVSKLENKKKENIKSNDGFSTQAPRSHLDTNKSSALSKDNELIGKDSVSSDELKNKLITKESKPESLEAKNKNDTASISNLKNDKLSTGNATSEAKKIIVVTGKNPMVPTSGAKVLTSKVLSMEKNKEEEGKLEKKIESKVQTSTASGSKSTAADGKVSLDKKLQETTNTTPKTIVKSMLKETGKGVKIEILSENGTTEGRKLQQQKKQTEVVKPFRVDFDED